MDGTLDGTLTELQKKFLEELKIKDLYSHQKEALPYIEKNKNILLSTPTASGKSLIAYLAILKSLEENKKAVFIVPLRALASEKYAELKIIEKYGYKVGKATGSVEDVFKPEKYDVIIATTEKMDGILRSGSKWIDKIGVVVVDEIHIIGEKNRGPTLEALISKIKTFNPNIVIHGLSATIPNVDEIGEWLDAKAIESTWRPVKLKVHLLNTNSNELINEMGLNEKSNVNLYSIIKETIKSKGQIIIFTNSRKSSERIANDYSSIIAPMLSSEEIGAIKEYVNETDEEESQVEINLKNLAKSGIAFHHAGLSNKARDTIETLFKKRYIKMIVATPTLAAGVNLPAKTVIINDIWRYDNGRQVPLSNFEIKQMCGRAGRPGYDSEGEAIIVVNGNNNMEIAMEKYINGETEKINSQLLNEGMLYTHFLSIIASSRQNINIDVLKNFLENTFAYYQNEYLTVEDIIENSVKYLYDNGFIETDGYNLKSTMLGKLTSLMYIHVETALKFKKLLESYTQMDPLVFLQVLALNPNNYGIRVPKWKESVIYRAINSNKWFMLEKERDLGYTEQFKESVNLALMLQDWINEVPIYKIEENYSIGPGDIANIIENTKWLSYALFQFSKVFNNVLSNDLDKLSVQIKYGIKPELIDLIQLSGIGRIRSRKLYDAGVKNVDDFTKINPEILYKIIPKKTAMKIIKKWIETKK
ncbi:MAG: DEAD/DEAH box helicase [Thermoplasmata archaeon]